MAQLLVQQLFEQAVGHHQAGRLADAERLYRQILTQHPHHPDTIHLLGVVVHQLGKNDDAVKLIRQAIALKPDFPEAYSNLGIALKEIGQLDEAIAACQRAVELKSDYADAYSNLGLALTEKGRLDEAIAAARRAIALNANFPTAYVNLGGALKSKGQPADAIAAFRQAIAINPNYAEAHTNLGDVLNDIGQTAEALNAHRKAIALNHNLPEAYNNLGNALVADGRRDVAITAYRQAIALRPRYAQAYTNLGNALKDARQLDDAIAAHRAAIAIGPDYAEALNNLGIALTENKQLDAAVAAYEQAIAIKPHFPEAFNNLANALKERGELDEAVAAFHQAVSLRPNYAEAHSNLAVLFKDLGRLDESIAAFRDAIAIKPELSEVHSKLIFTMHYHPACDVKTIAEELKQWNRNYAEPLRTFIEPHTNNANPDRRLRIGYVSPDLRDHVVGQNLLPLFHKHDRTQFEIFCYAQVPHPDAMTAQFQKYADHWRNIVDLSDDETARKIRDDKIDILVDLAMHTGLNRLLVFALKPAPVQFTGFAYPGSTGLATIDYRLTDPFLDPPGMFDEFYSEQSVRLPDSFWCYQPLPGMEGQDQKVANLPAAKNGYVTFGCLNNFCKITDAALDLWASVLTATPTSRLLLLAPPGSATTDLLKKLQSKGVDPQRLEIVGRQIRSQYLQLYNRIDIGLDTIPYNGHTTSLDSYWMGVPVVTLVGSTVVGRAGWCQLCNLGLKKLAAQTPAEFVQIAAKLAADIPRLAQLRSSLRQRMQRSPLMDAPRFAHNIESAYRQMWQKWCESRAS